MMFLMKSPCSKILLESMKYIVGYTQNNRDLKELLAEEQGGYCAYSEKYLMPMDSVDVEHFDSSLKNTAGDNYFNWYAVIHKVNQKKGAKKLADFQPILAPWSEQVSERIEYRAGLFVPVDPADKAAKNLIDYIEANNAVVFEQRRKHIENLKELRGLLPKEMFLKVIRSDPKYSSFLSAISVELGIEPAEVF